MRKVGILCDLTKPDIYAAPPIEPVDAAQRLKKSLLGNLFGNSPVLAQRKNIVIDIPEIFLIYSLKIAHCLTPLSSI